MWRAATWPATRWAGTSFRPAIPATCPSAIATCMAQRVTAAAAYGQLSVPREAVTKWTSSSSTAPAPRRLRRADPCLAAVDRHLETLRDPVDRPRLARRLPRRLIQGRHAASTWGNGGACCLPSQSRPASACTTCISTWSGASFLGPTTRTWASSPIGRDDGQSRPDCRHDRRPRRHPARRRGTGAVSPRGCQVPRMRRVAVARSRPGSGRPPRTRGCARAGTSRPPAS